MQARRSDNCHAYVQHSSSASSIDRVINRPAPAKHALLAYRSDPTDKGYLNLADTIRTLPSINQSTNRSTRSRRPRDQEVALAHLERMEEDAVLVGWKKSTR